MQRYLPTHKTITSARPSLALQASMTQSYLPMDDTVTRVITCASGFDDATVTDGPTRPRAFTLIELLVAMALSLLLLSGVYSAIHLYWQLSTAGREQMEQAQVARALFRQIELDVRATVYPLQEAVSSGSSSSSATSTSTTGTTGQATADDELAALEAEVYEDPLTGVSIGIIGDSESLILHSNRPSRDMAYYAIHDTAFATDRVGDLAAVSYFLAVRGAGGLSGAVADSTSAGPTSSVVSRGSVRGLARLESDQLSMGFSDDAVQLESLASTAQLIAPEVISLTFSYWDGFEWADTWDSDLDGCLPSAIEVTIGLRESENSGRKSAQGEISRAIGANEEPVTYYRHVIVPPLADPYPQATSAL